MISPRRCYSRPNQENANYYKLEAFRQGADFIDMEFSAGFEKILQRVRRERLILSYHNFHETPEDLEFPSRAS